MLKKLADLDVIKSKYLEAMTNVHKIEENVQKILYFIIFISF